ncbi:N-acetylmuramoyl-L-alanine amidase [Streptomyces sp. NPDC006339]|uniref:N-acetylmuramoyl-L-alanine amidase n=1 Tax=Streptomyces sp. NPDC006339 TaxID=3156755 RepID=UPI0033A7DAF7
MQLVTRAQWGARAYRLPSGATLYSRPRRGVKLHYLGTPYTDRPHDRCDDYVRQIQAQHMDGNGWSDIGYSFLVCTHGYVYEGRGLRRRNSANGSTSLNEQDYAVCLLVGSSGLAEPTNAQLHGTRDAIEYCRAEGPAGTWLGGHRDGYATSCPGGPIYAWAQAGAPRPTTATPEEDDVPLTDAEIKKIAVAAREEVWGVQWKSPTDPDGPTRSAATFERWADVRHQREMEQLAAIRAAAGATLTDEQLAALADRVAAHPTLAERIAELVADKLAARLTD